MNSFHYHRASSLNEAALRLSGNDQARLLAGGMTLIPSLKHRLLAVGELIDIARLPDLQEIRIEADAVWVGAAVRHHQVASHAELAQALPALAELAGLIGDPQVRSRGTLGGSIANNDPAADYPAAVLALGATVVTTQREIAADDFFLGMFTTALEPGEVIRGVRFPRPVRSAYAKFRHPASGYAMSGVFLADFGGQGRRVAVTGATDAVCRWPQAEVAWQAGQTPAAFAHEGLLGDIHAPARYRAHLTDLMYAQALKHLR
ncbi:MAG: carbon monoxide dehydrogenase medium chain [Pseudomonadota bacterium]|jgi:carbon-monoxide dehydrogenase medium subunit